MNFPILFLPLTKKPRLRPTFKVSLSVSLSVKMADGGLAVLDGTHLRGADLLLSLPDGAVTGAQLVQLCESEASTHLFGLSLPEPVKSAVIRRLNGGDVGGLLEKEFGDEGSKRGMVKGYLDALADELKGLNYP